MFERFRFFPVIIAILIAFMGLKAMDIRSGVGTQFGGIAPAMASGSNTPDEHVEETHDGEPANDLAIDDGRTNVEGINPASGYLSAGDVDVLNSVEDRDAKYKSWEEQLKMRERMLEVAEGKVEEKIVELRGLEATLRKLVEMQSERKKQICRDW